LNSRTYCLVTRYGKSIAKLAKHRATFELRDRGQKRRNALAYNEKQLAAGQRDELF